MWPYPMAGKLAFSPPSVAPALDSKLYKRQNFNTKRRPKLQHTVSTLPIGVILLKRAWDEILDDEKKSSRCNFSYLVRSIPKRRRSGKRSCTFLSCKNPCSRKFHHRHGAPDGLASLLSLRVQSYPSQFHFTVVLQDRVCVPSWNQFLREVQNHRLSLRTWNPTLLQYFPKK